MIEELHRIYGKARLNDRQINELIGLAHGLIADGGVNQSEAEYLQKWLVVNREASENPVTANLLCRVNAMLADGVLDVEESKELYETLRKFSGGNFELGELQKSCELPLDTPLPEVVCTDRNFCFTGTFAFGTRKDCEAAVTRKGGRCGSLNQKTNFLVIGVYATESWKHSSYGLKIEKAVSMKREGMPISIISETHWLGSVQA